MSYRYQQLIKTAKAKQDAEFFTELIGKRPSEIPSEDLMDVRDRLASAKSALEREIHTRHGRNP